MQENELGISRSGGQIPKLKTRGRINRHKLLNAAKELLRRETGNAIRFKEVFAAAGISRGSAYRIYDGMEDLMQDLTCEWINSYTRLIKATHENVRPATWMELIDSIIRISAGHWIASSATLSAVPRYHSAVPANYLKSMRSLMQAYAKILNKYFDIPYVPNWLSILGVGLQLSDTIYANAMRRGGGISERSIIESQKICRIYLAMHIPEAIPPRSL